MRPKLSIIRNFHSRPATIGAIISGYRKTVRQISDLRRQGGEQQGHAQAEGELEGDHHQGVGQGAPACAHERLGGEGPDVVVQADEVAGAAGHG